MAEHNLAEILRFSCLMIEYLGKNATKVARRQLDISEDDMVADVWRAILVDVHVLLG